MESTLVKDVHLRTPVTGGVQRRWVSHSSSDDSQCSKTRDRTAVGTSDALPRVEEAPVKRVDIFLPGPDSPDVRGRSGVPRVQTCRPWGRGVGEKDQGGRRDCWSLREIDSCQTSAEGKSEGRCPSGESDRELGGSGRLREGSPVHVLGGDTTGEPDDTLPPLVQ